jgi:hypothetical protein
MLPMAAGPAEKILGGIQGAKDLASFRSGAGMEAFPAAPALVLFIRSGIG